MGELNFVTADPIGFYLNIIGKTDLKVVKDPLDSMQTIYIPY